MFMIYKEVVIRECKITKTIDTYIAVWTDLILQKYEEKYFKLVLYETESDMLNSLIV